MYSESVTEIQECFNIWQESYDTVRPYVPRYDFCTEFRKCAFSPLSLIDEVGGFLPTQSMHWSHATSSAGNLFAEISQVAGSLGEINVTEIFNHRDVLIHQACKPDLNMKELY